MQGSASTRAAAADNPAFEPPTENVYLEGRRDDVNVDDDDRGADVMELKDLTVPAGEGTTQSGAELADQTTTERRPDVVYAIRRDSPIDQLVT